MNSPVEKIKQRLSIVDVISSYLTLEQAGKNYKAKCPFHNEKTPSFFISPDRGSYYCFGCGAKGDIFSFVEHFEGTDFKGSLKLLAERAGIPLTYDYSQNVQEEKERYFQIMEEAAIFFESNLDKKLEARSYLLSRGLSDLSIKNFRIGFAPDSWRSVSDHLINKGFKKVDLETVGLIKNKNDGFYDRFRSRIMFPISDSSGRVIAFSGRIFASSAEALAKAGQTQSEAKYLNSPDTPLFSKSNVLYGIDKAKLAIKTRGYSVVVEGQMDLILSHQALFTNTVAVSGTAFTDSVDDSESKINNLGLIRRLSSNIIFAYDGDSAGIRAASRSAMIALSLDMQVKIAILPEGKDPADIIKENTETWKDIIKNSVNIISFHLNRISESTKDLRMRGKQVREIIFPFLVVVKSAIEKSAYINEIHKKTGLFEQAIIKDFEIYESSHGPEFKMEIKKEEKSKDVVSRRNSLEKRFFGVIFWLEGKENQSTILDICNSFEVEIGSELFSKMKTLHEPFADSLAFEAEMWYGTDNDAFTRDLKEIILNLEEEIYNEQANYLREEINRKEQNSEGESLAQTLVDYQIIIGKIEEIKSRRSK